MLAFIIAYNRRGFVRILYHLLGRWYRAQSRTVRASTRLALTRCVCRQGVRRHVHPTFVLLAEARKFRHLQEEHRRRTVDTVPILQVSRVLSTVFFLFFGEITR